MTTGQQKVNAKYGQSKKPAVEYQLKIFEKETLRLGWQINAAKTEVMISPRLLWTCPRLRWW
jgi:hypothetical protein